VLFLDPHKLSGVSDSPCVVVSQDEANASVEPCNQGLNGHTRAMESKVPQVIHVVLWAYYLIPDAYQSLVHFDGACVFGFFAEPFVVFIDVAGSPRTVAVTCYVCMSKMGIC